MVNKSWQWQTHRRAHLVHSQIQAAQTLLRTTGQMDPALLLADGSPYFDLLDRLYSEDFPLAVILDGSDLVVHAEGPGAREHSPSLSTVNWLCSRMEKRLRTLVQAVLPMAQDDAKAASRELDLRLTGMAPGSLYLGFSIADAEPGALGLDDGGAAMLLVRGAMHSLPMVPQFVSDTDVRREIFDALPDPALRDAAMVAACEMAPTGHKGIHTVDISSPGNGGMGRISGVLGQRERVVLRDATRRTPMMMAPQDGVFVGEVREVDLDARRFQLRNVPGVGTLRCAVDALHVEMARKLLGAGVVVRGRYEADATGRPRIMQVDHIEPFQVQANLQD